jgi:hypothetical protein
MTLEEYYTPTWTYTPYYTPAPYTTNPEVKVTINGFSSEQWLVIGEMQDTLSRIERLLERIIEKESEKRV